MTTPLSLLARGVESLLPGYDPATGLLNDPVFGCPTQYSTPYYAWCSAVLAMHKKSGAYAARGARGLRAALDYLLDPALPPYPSEFRRDTGASAGRNHRDFFWPPVLKTWELLGRLGAPLPTDFDYAKVNAGIARVDALAAFAMRPPSNWAAVWLSGEWLRLRAGLSPFSRETFDEWLGRFFEGHALPERGLYQEPGHPHSYDLFTRFHFADMLLNGYDGRWRAEMEALLVNGLRRSLAVQLSDGALASAHRSTGQSWTDGAQAAFFTHAANFLAGQDPPLAEAARAGASRAFASLERWERGINHRDTEDTEKNFEWRAAPHSPLGKRSAWGAEAAAPQGGAEAAAVFSPVYNVLPAEMRVGYESYTADGHYSTLALAFLATAIQAGFEPVPFGPRPAQAFIEGDPTWRAILHHGQTSLQVNAFPAPEYDAFGITDLTFGPGRWLHLSSSVRHLESGRLLNPGLALWTAAIQHGPAAAAGAIGAVAPAATPHWGAEAAGDGPYLIEPLRPGDSPASVRLAARPRGAFYPYILEASLDPDGARVREATPGRSGRRTLLVPFLRDAGGGHVTRWSFGPGRLELAMGAERLAVEWDGPAERAFVLAQGFENRRGLCALARIDLAEEGEELRWGVRREA